MENAQIDIIRNGNNVADVLLKHGFHVNNLRPFVDPVSGGCYVLNKAGVAVPVTNATLLKDEWIQLDRAVVQAAKSRMTAVADLQARGLTYNLPNAMGKTVMQYQNASDISDATISMEGINKSMADRPMYDITNLPLPIIHKDFYYTAREIEASRNEGTPIDVSTAELAARKVAEAAEKLVLGTYGTYAFAGGNIYGYENFPNATARTVTDWTASAKTGEQIFTDVLNMKQDSKDDLHYGPWVLYVSSNWEKPLEEDYKSAVSGSVRKRLMEIDGLLDIRVADYMTASKAVLVQQTADTAQLVVGFNPTTIQWQTEGGMMYNFKVMAILVPRIRSDYNDTSGIVVASV